MMSDSVIFYGLQRAPYIGVAGGIGVVSLFALGFMSLPLLIAALFIFGVNLSVASPDVMIDAIIAQQCKYYPKFSSDLQSLCWGSYAVFSVIGYGISGISIQIAGPRGTFLIVMVSAGAVFLPTLLGFVGEKRLRQQLAAAMALETNSETTGVDTGSRNRMSQQSVGVSGDEETGGKGQWGGDGGAREAGEDDEVRSPIQGNSDSEHCNSLASTVHSSRQQDNSTRNVDIDRYTTDEMHSGDKMDVDAKRPSNIVDARDSLAHSVRESRKTASAYPRPVHSSAPSLFALDLTLYRTHRSVFYLGLWVPFCAVLLALIVFVIQEWVIRFAAVTLVAFLVAGSVYIVNYKKMPLLANVALFIFLRQVFTPDIETVMFYWLEFLVLCF